MATNSHPLTLDNAINLLTLTMRDPLKANICSTRIGNAADRINQALEARNSVSAKTKLAKSYPEFLRAGIKFLTLKQSPQEFVRMMNYLVQCRCDFGQTGMRRLHTPSSSRLSHSHVFEAVATVSNCIILALSELSQHKFRTGRSNNNDELRWPQGPEDLLPFGPKDSITGLERWVAGPPHGYIIFKLAGILALSHVPFAREVFQYPDFTFALARPCQHLKAAIKFYNDDSSPLARIQFFERPIMAICQFFDDLSQVDTPRFNMMLVACRDWLKPILTPLTTILSTLPPEWAQIRMQVNCLNSYANAEVDRKTGGAIIKFDRSQFAEVINQRLDPLEKAFSAMVEARKVLCWNIQCPSQSEDLPSRLCSRCSLLRFCGERCQKDAWKSTPLPHKPLCAMIYSLKEALGSADWSLLWTLDFTYAQFQAMCKTKNIDTEAVKVIASSISALRIRKSAFLQDLRDAGESPSDKLIRAQGQSWIREKSKNLIDSLGGQVKVIPDREAGFLAIDPEAYKLC